MKRCVRCISVLTDDAHPMCVWCRTFCRECSGKGYTFWAPGAAGVEPYRVGETYVEKKPCAACRGQDAAGSVAAGRGLSRACHYHTRGYRAQACHTWPAGPYQA